MPRRIDRTITREERADKLERPSPSVLKNWLERVDGRFMGEPLDVDPTDAILWAMRISAGELVYCDQQIRRLEEDELFERPTQTTIVTMPSGAVEAVTEKRDAENMSRWVRWRDHAARRMAQYAEMALRLGIEAEQVKIAKQQAQQIVNVISSVLVDLGHDLTDYRTREVVRKRLLETAINGTATDVIELEKNVA